MGGAVVFALPAPNKISPGAWEPGQGQPRNGLTVTWKKPELQPLLWRGPSWDQTLCICGCVFFFFTRLCLIAQTSGPNELWICPWLVHRYKYHAGRTPRWR